MCIFIGALIAGLLVFFPGSIFIFSLVLIFGLLMWFLLPESGERKFLLAILSTGFLLRISAVLFVHLLLGLSEQYYQCNDQPVIAIFGDSAYYTLRSWWMARYWLGEPISQEFVQFAFQPTYGKSSYLYILAFFHYLFYFGPVSSKFINCLLGTATGIIVYFIAKQVFTTKVARLSAIFTVLFPSMFLWSLSNLKDTSIIFLISVVLWSFINFQQSKKAYYLMFLILALCSLPTLRKSLGLCMIFIVVFSYLCITKISLVKKIGICLAALIFLQGFLSAKGKNLKSLISEQLTAIVHIHQGVVHTGGSVYRLLDEKYYLNKNSKPTGGHPDTRLYGPADMHLQDYAKMFFKGWTHFLLEPFPWKMHTRQMLFSYPQMLFWYFLLPFAFLGMILAARYNWRLSLVVFVYLFVFGSILAVSGGNIGTNLRHRDMITPVFLLFASAGLIHICRGDFNFKSKNIEIK